ncbi:MAG: hypothetical protein KJ944_10015 [Alphaproteobacteria bacterium]|nr:hypothetical protein [Alphaproteobacteria bacterium]MBU1560713.1 hypothetical protein [Alphaproteobacteria bacterium]MBU2302922.1 hypothetical protein [Alphaproteobacteria bacterium]MBU2367649.1 hypothetical protein [Alphaproteobacteria bacterium]
MPGNTIHASPGASTLLLHLIHRAGFAPDELTIVQSDVVGGSVRLPVGLDPMSFRVRDLGYMLKAYGLPYEIIAHPGP